MNDNSEDFESQFARETDIRHLNYKDIPFGFPQGAQRTRVSLKSMDQMNGNLLPPSPRDASN